MARGETIAALSTGALPAGIAVVRVSGPQARSLAEALAGRPVPPRRPLLATICDPETAEALDRGLVLVFPGPGSATGEDVAEFHLHGSRAVVAAVLDAVCRREGVRLAEPGEFTRRAFLAGRMDLTEVEGLGDLLAAGTDAQRRQALRLATGALRERALAWRERLVALRARVEAELDFSDEEDVAGDLAPVFDGVRSLSGEIGATLRGSATAERLRDGVRIAVVGPPNAGKSSLVNLIARRDVAIVTEHAGTTRDVIEVDLDLGGYPATLLDTAGLRDAADPVEAIGVERARRAAGEADVVVAVLDALSSPAPVAWPDPGERPLVRVVNKVDRLGDRPAPAADVRLSALTGEGLEELVERLKTVVAGMLAPAESAVVARSRQREALEGCRRALDRAGSLGADGPLVLVAEELRLAGDALGRLTGAIDVEDVLDNVFGTFCIGK